MGTMMTGAQGPEGQDQRVVPPLGRQRAFEIAGESIGEEPVTVPIRKQQIGRDPEPKDRDTQP
jgi:hypothetical protein